MINAYYTLVWCIAALTVAQSVTGSASSPEKWWLGGGIVVFFSVCAVCRSTRLFALTTTITLAAPIYLMEVYLTLGYGTPLGKTEAVRRLRENGIRAYPPVFPSGLIAYYGASGRTATVDVDGIPVLPLSGIPGQPTVYCIAKGNVIGYVSDPLGFRNPARSYEAKRLAFAILGDSFAQGYCVQQDATYAARFSALGPTISFGVNSSSTLVQYAIYQEFVASRRPAHVIWMFFGGNDLEGFALERAFPPTNAYMDPGYSQNLEAVKGKVAEALERMIDESLTSLLVRSLAHDPAEPPPTFGQTLRSVIVVQRTRRIIESALVDWGHLGRAAEILDKRARRRLAMWDTHGEAMITLWRRVVAHQRDIGGTTTFVYIPDLLRFKRSLSVDPLDPLEQAIRRSWDELGVDHVSLTEMLRASAEPARLIAGIHFSDAGYRATAAFVAAHIASREAGPVLSVSDPGQP